jgi:hypothetical protein
VPSYNDIIKNNEEVFLKRWDAFTGADMRVVFDNKEVGTVSSLTVTITRDVIPRYTSGDANARTFAKGRRGIGGTMTFSVFDRHPILRDVFADKYYQQLQSLWAETSKTFGYNVFQSGTGGTIPDIETPKNLREGVSASSIEEALEIHRLMGQYIKIKYIDQLPPIDVTITFANDAGAVSVATLKGIVFLSEGIGWTMGDVDTEVATTYLAREFTPLTALLSSENRSRL